MAFLVCPTKFAPVTPQGTVNFPSKPALQKEREKEVKEMGIGRTSAFVLAFAIGMPLEQVSANLP